VPFVGTGARGLLAIGVLVSFLSEYVSFQVWR
jgi:hypothetical protein